MLPNHGPSDHAFDPVWRAHTQRTIAIDAVRQALYGAPRIVPGDAGADG